MLAQIEVAQATQVDVLVGSVANGLNSSGGCRAGWRAVVDHQQIDGASLVSSAAVPALFAASASEGIKILRNTPSILTTLQEKERAIRAVLDRVEAVTIPSHTASPIIHICVHEARELRDPCVARCTLGAPTAGHRERGIRAGRVDHAGAPAVRTGACRGAAVHPPRRLGSVVTQGIASKPLLSSRLPSRRRL